MKLDIKNCRIGILGLGYVGLPLAVEFGKQYPTVGFDLNTERVKELTSGIDSTLECSSEELVSSTNLTYSCELASLSDCNVIIVTVPTPIDEHKKPDLTPLIRASQMIGKIVKKDDVVIYESTVYPGATEEVCIPLIEEASGFVFNQDFFAGYSPERINPGDKARRVSNIIKITSGSTPDISNFVDDLYSSIITAGTHKASSIKVAEAAKIIENTQRDVNIALINELAIIFNRLGIDTLEVLEAAGTKWNFLPFRPGLVGGHCIGVDPYYLTHKSQSVGYFPDIIIASRRLNDGMAQHVVSQLIKTMIQKTIQVQHANVLLMGFAFKENCPDVRNTKLIDIVTELKEYKANIDIYDPWCSAQEVKRDFNLDLVEPRKGKYDAIIVAVAHNEFLNMDPLYLRSLGKKQCVIYDLKYVFDKQVVDIRL